MFPVRELVKSNVSLHTARDASDSSFKIAVTQDDQVSEIKIDLNQISVPDLVLLHKQSTDILYINVLNLALMNSKLQGKNEKLEARLKQEQAANAANQKQMKILETDLVASETDPQDVKVTQKLLDEKNKIIQDLKKKLQVPATHITQTNELAEVRSERDRVKGDLLDVQAEVVELKEERRILNERLEQYKLVNTSLEITTTQTNDVASVDTQKINRLMAQTNLKDQEIHELREQVQKLKQEVAQATEGKKKTNT